MDSNKDRRRKVQSVQDMIGIGSEFERSMHGSFDGIGQSGRNNRNPNMPPMMNQGMNQGMNPNMPPMMNQGMNPRQNSIFPNDASERLANELRKNINGRNGAESRDNREHSKKRHGYSERSGDNSEKYRNNSQNSNSVASLLREFSGIAPYAYCAILVICLMTALIAYGTTHKGTSSYNIPTDGTILTGVIPELFLKTLDGATSNVGMSEDGTSQIPEAPVANTDLTGNSGSSQVHTVPSGTDNVSGAAMVVDSGAGVQGYSEAASYSELLTQIESAIAIGDVNFVGSKLCYKDDEGNICGYPQSVVDYFVSYMSLESEKRAGFISEITADKYSYTNGDVYVVCLPKIKFVVNMGYDNTTVSLSGFADQVVNAGEKAEIAPLLPCMYTIVISNDEWPESTTRSLEANVNETQLAINIK